MTDRGWVPSEAWQARSAWRSGPPDGGPAPVIPASAGMMMRLVSRVKNRAVDRPRR